MDDISVTQEGEHVDPDSIISMPAKDGIPIFPTYERRALDPFLLEINRSGKKWIIIADEHNQPYMILNANAFLRKSLFDSGPTNPYIYCHRPIIVKDSNTLLDKVLSRLQVSPKSEADDVVDNDLILIWSNEKRVITGADILGRLLRGIAIRDIKHAQKREI